MVIWTLVLMVGLMVALTSYLVIRYKDKIQFQKIRLWHLLTSAFVLRLIAAYALSFFSKSTHMDVHWWIEWTRYFTDHSVRDYYIQWIGDYTPGYMYYLKLCAVILGDRFPLDGHLAQLLYKLPPMVFDVLSGWMIYYLAKGREERERLFCVAMYVFQPIVLLISVAWGQLDCTYALLIATAIYFLRKEKIELAGIMTALSILIKLQSLVWGVVFLFGLAMYLLRDGFAMKKVWRILGAGLLSIGVLLLGMLPCSIPHVLQCMVRTLGSYEVASMNAANFWSMVGQNMVSQYETFIGIPFATYGTIFLILSIAGVVYYCISHREQEEVMYVGTGWMYLTFFTFEVRMHERYAFAALLMLLCAYALSGKMQYLKMYSVFSVLLFFNCAYSLTLVSRQDLATATFQWLGAVVVAAVIFEWIRLMRKTIS